MRWNLTITLVAIGFAGPALVARGQGAGAPNAKAAATGASAKVDPAVKPAQGKAKAQAAQKAREDDPAQVEKMERVLQTWQKQSQKNERLEATFKRVDVKKILGEKEEYEGRALLAKPNKAVLDLNRIEPPAPGDPKKLPVKTFHERIICTGSEVYHYRNALKEIIVYPLPKNQKAKALEEGPMPFLFNMNAAELKRRYKLTLYGETKEKYGIKVVPLEDMDRESFSMAAIVLDKAKMLPTELKLYSPNGKDTQTYTFVDLKVNGEMNMSNFEGKDWGKGWKVVRNPAPDEQPPAGRPRAAAGAGQPAPRQAAAPAGRGRLAPRDAATPAR